MKGLVDIKVLTSYISHKSLRCPRVVVHMNGFKINVSVSMHDQIAWIHTDRGFSEWASTDPHVLLEGSSSTMWYGDFIAYMGMMMQSTTPLIRHA